MLNSIFMEHLNQTNYCCSLGTAALLFSRMMFTQMGDRLQWYVLLLLCFPCSDGKVLHVLINSKKNQISFAVQLKKHKQKKQDPKSSSTKSKNFFFL